jgi:molybdopterin-binding protein
MKDMAEFNSKVTVARPKSLSLRTTIPEAVVKMLELKAGDEISWIVKPTPRGIEVSITK